MAFRHELIRDYGGTPGASDTHIDLFPQAAIAIVSLGNRNTYNRITERPVDDDVGDTGQAFRRAVRPLVLADEVRRVAVQNSKSSHTKSLNAVLRTATDYRGKVVPGDWVFAWIWTSAEQANRVLDAIRSGTKANGPDDGLRFVGRLHGIRQREAIDRGSGRIDTSYVLQAVGFAELDSTFFYDFALATAAATRSLMSTFMAQIGLSYSDWADQEQQRAGQIKDNADRLIPALLNMILGKGLPGEVNQPIERAADAAQAVDPTQTGFSRLRISPQANKEAPQAYVVPRTAGLLLGRDPADASKQGVFGYADILDTLIGMQEYASTRVPYPELDTSRSTTSRKYTREPVKGTFLPVNPTFVNAPLWGIFQQYLNPVVNEMYTALHQDQAGDVVPHLVVRQIPFSSEAASASADFPLTRFSSLPRWVLDRALVYESDLGMSDGTRTNMVHVYGDASMFANNRSVTDQLIRNPPLFDEVDVRRSGMRAMMHTVNCAVQDQVRVDGARLWMGMAADHLFGSHLTLNGTLTTVGARAPVAEGDNLEYAGVIYHVEGVSHDYAVTDGYPPRRSYVTRYELSRGVPVNQDGAADDGFPRYFQVPPGDEEPVPPKSPNITEDKA